MPRGFTVFETRLQRVDERLGKVSSSKKAGRLDIQPEQHGGTSG